MNALLSGFRRAIAVVFPGMIYSVWIVGVGKWWEVFFWGSVCEGLVSYGVFCSTEISGLIKGCSHNPVYFACRQVFLSILVPLSIARLVKLRCFMRKIIRVARKYGG